MISIYECKHIKYNIKTLLKYYAFDLSLTDIVIFLQLDAYKMYLM